jgi:hypothetical protein
MHRLTERWAKRLAFRLVVSWIMFFLCWAGPANATDWVFVGGVGKAPKRSLTAISAVSPGTFGRQGYSWTINEDRESFKTVKRFLEFDCSKRRVRIAKSNIETWDGQIVTDHSVQPWRPAASDSDLRWMLAYACHLPMRVRPRSPENDDPMNEARKFFAKGGTDFEFQAYPYEKISRSSFYGGRNLLWPLTVDFGTLGCTGHVMWFIAPDGTIYGLNDAARKAGYAPIDPIWARKTNGFGLPSEQFEHAYMDALLSEGLKHCSN